jgi:hypothetical protein
MIFRIDTGLMFQAGLMFQQTAMRMCPGNEMRMRVTCC